MLVQLYKSAYLKFKASKCLIAFITLFQIKRFSQVFVKIWIKARKLNLNVRFEI